MNLWWAPGQSEAAREIARHLSGREKAGLAGLSALFAVSVFGFAVVLMDAVAGAGPIRGRLEGFAVPVLLGLGAGAWLALALQRRLLLGTRVAREQGYTLAEITARPPLTPRDFLVLGGVSALVASIAIALAAILFAGA